MVVRFQWLAGRDWCVLAGGFLLLAVSFNTWRQVSLLVQAGDPAYQLHYRADAWSASPVWAVALALGLAAALLWSVGRARPAPPRWLRPVAALLFGTGAALLVGRAVTLPAVAAPDVTRPASAVSYRPDLSPSAPDGAASLARGAVGVGLGWWAGLALLVGMLVLVLAPRADRADRAELPDPPAVAGAPVRSVRFWAVAGLGVLLLGVSLMSWYRAEWRGRPGLAQPGSSANAWQASTLWTVAVCAGIFAVVLWLGLYQPGGPPDPAGAAAALLVGGAILLTLGVWVQAYRPVVSIEPGADPAFGDLPVPVDIGQVHRDDLTAAFRTRPGELPDDGYAVGPDTGATLGPVVLGALLLVVLTDTTHRRRTDQAPSPPPTGLPGR